MTPQQELDEKILAIRSRIIYRLARRLGCRTELSFILDQMRTQRTARCLKR